MQKKYFYLNSRDEFYRVDVSNIVYLEADGNYTNFVLSNGEKGVVGMNLTHMKDVMKESLGEHAGKFARIGKRFIINLDYVYHIDVLRQRLRMSDGSRFFYQLSVSKEALKNLKEMFVKSMMMKQQAVTPAE